MQMTLEADYAVRIVEFLTECNKKCDAKTISENTDITLRFALKILRKLVTSGMVQSYKGAKGGYTLSRPPENITLLEVIEAVEGPYVINRCQREEYVCGKTECRMHKIYAEICENVKKELSSYDFKSICASEKVKVHKPKAGG